MNGHECLDHPTNPEASSEFAALEQGICQIWEIARQFGLDPFPTHFEIVPPDIMSEMGSYGIPGHFSHWTYGRTYRILKTQYDHGLMRIYEMVVNSDPSHAFLLDNNPLAINLKVAAHVNAHVDFFKNNFLFRETRRDMPTASSLRAERLREYEEKYGALTIEQFLDACMTISEHIDPGKFYRPAPADQLAKWKREFETVKRPRPTEFDEIYDLDPASKGKKTNEKPAKMPLPLRPDKDILGFIRDFAPYLEDWQRDVIDIVREEAYYFYPQARTKIMNEGWATFWHTRIMHEMRHRGFITPAQAEEWWIAHQGVAMPMKDRLNPYFFGLIMFEYLAEYFNGQLKDDETAWLVANNFPVYPRFKGEFKDSPGLAEIRRIMITNDDASFIGSYFNAIPARRMGAYLYMEEEDDETEDINYVISTTDWQEVRDFLVAARANNGEPFIVVRDADFEDRHELVLDHRFDGRELRIAYVKKTLPYLYNLWKRPVHLTTVHGDDMIQYSYDGQSLTEKTLYKVDLTKPPYSTLPV